MVDNAPRVLAARYEVGELIGRGGMAEVHIGRDTRLGRTVAIKILRSDLARDPSFLARFRREAQSAAALNHPSIVAVYDTGEDVGTDSQGAQTHVPFIVMEYVEGHTVRDIVRDGHSVPIEEAVEITAGVLSALEYSHHAGIVHRDIKPANVMITPTGTVKVMDFGIARAVADSAATMTQTHSVIGTAQYLSPEQARGETVDARSDLYSTGCLFFEMLTGRPPFIGDSPVAVAYQHVRETPPRPSELAPDVPEVLDRITLKSLAKERTDRYSSAGEFRADLEAAVNGGHVSAGAIGAVAAAAGLAAGAGATQVMGAEQGTQVMGAQTNPWGTTPVALPPDSAGTPEGPEEEPKKSRKGLIWTLVTIGVLAIAAIIAIIALQGPDEPDTVAVPTVTADMDAEAARAAIEGKDLVFSQREVADDSDKGTFVRQDPRGGTQVAPRSTVTVFFSSGPGQVTVPDVAGKSQADARDALQEAGLEVGNVESEHSKDVPEDQVTKTDPAIGDTVADGATVDLFVSDGKVELPDVTNMKQADAESALKDVGLTAVVTKEPTDKADEGVVFQQDPGKGEVAQGSSVDLTVATKPETPKTNVPNLEGLTLDQASSELGRANLNMGNQSQQASDKLAAGQVIATDPAASTQVDEGSSVNVVVSSGPGPQTPPAPGSDQGGDDGTATPGDDATGDDGAGGGEDGAAGGGNG
ncbi:Stk1 family PASTA domain-containing Ser/Thr kinase [Cellulomonas sp. PhB143]|uniref:Stk1 family PASTA domain-containing Ser/Thr kinase n=1 Tax=Cellulomonas sp. PhB143 TaxID=2485186 RepID=UPI000F4ABA2B|nr:Stk1 family PASTA domain-containing Ser/Thr kinase [Cellulomonas sp. PhB143]ROS75572.1 serine/threonine-protein kinase [Cellulomonas sp. PhB143]